MEPVVTIDGKWLSEEESKALRVAIDTFTHPLMHVPGTNFDDIRGRYLHDLNSIRKLLFEWTRDA